MDGIISRFYNIGKSYISKNSNISCFDLDTTYFKKLSGSNWEEVYVECARGSDKNFTKGFFSRWDSHINDCERNRCPNKIVLKSGEYLSDVLEKCK